MQEETKYKNLLKIFVVVNILWVVFSGFQIWSHLTDNMTNNKLISVLDNNLQEIYREKYTYNKTYKELLAEIPSATFNKNEYAVEFPIGWRIVRLEVERVRGTGVINEVIILPSPFYNKNFKVNSNSLKYIFIYGVPVIVFLILVFVAYFSVNTKKILAQYLAWWPLFFWMLIMIPFPRELSRVVENVVEDIYINYYGIPLILYYTIIYGVSIKTKLGDYLSKRNIFFAVASLLILYGCFLALAGMFSGFSSQGAGQ